MRFLKDGKGYVTSGVDGNISFWRTDEDRPYRTIGEPWVIGPGVQLYFIERLPLAGLALNEETGYIAAGTDTSINIWDADSGKLLIELGEAPKRTQVDVEELLASNSLGATNETLVKLLSLPSDSPRELVFWKVKPSSTETIQNLAFMPTRNWLVSSTREQVVVCDIKSDKIVMQADGTDFAVSSDDKYVAVGGGWQRRCRIYDVSDESWKTLDTRAVPVSFSRKGDELFMDEVDALYRYCLADGALERLAHEPGATSVRSVSYATDAGLLAVHWDGLNRENIVVYEVDKD